MEIKNSKGEIIKACPFRLIANSRTEGLLLNDSKCLENNCMLWSKYKNSNNGCCGLLR